jgi:hypothetical protein
MDFQTHFVVRQKISADNLNGPYEILFKYDSGIISLIINTYDLI